jgi:hypothetical protein
MQSLNDIMSNKDFDQPAEIIIIKDFVRKHFQKDVGVTLQQFSITITTHSAGLAGALRPMLYELKKDLKTDKKLFIRIG